MVQGMARRKLMVALATAALAALAPAHASADTFVPSSLRQAAAANPAQTFKVIVQGAPSVTSKGVAGDVQTQERSHPGREHGLRRSFRLLSGISAELTGRQILALSQQRRILAITPDIPHQRVKIHAEARDLAAMLAFHRHLQQSDGLAQVVLVDHAVSKDSPEKPVRFHVFASWGASHASP